MSFELAGTKSNRLALNARIKIVAGGMTQTDEVHSGGSYLSQNDLRLHFGLGSATKIDSVEIHWPSGAVDRIGQPRRRSVLCGARRPGNRPSRAGSPAPGLLKSPRHRLPSRRNDYLVVGFRSGSVALSSVAGGFFSRS